MNKATDIAALITENASLTLENVSLKADNVILLAGINALSEAGTLAGLLRQLDDLTEANAILLDEMDELHAEHVVASARLTEIVTYSSELLDKNKKLKKKNKKLAKELEYYTD